MTDENNGTEKIPYSTYNTLMLVVGPNKGKSALPLNPVKGDVSDPMFVKVISKSITVMITCKKYACISNIH